MRIPVVKPLRSSNVRASSRRSGLLTKREPTEAAPLIIPSSERSSRAWLALAGPWKSGLARPPSIRGDSRSRTSCTHALDRGARRSICKTVPVGTQRSSERRAPVWTGARARVPYVVGLRCAPSGTTPYSTKRQSAITSLRATATMPMRRLRPPAAAKRRRNQTASALSGCHRNQHHAT